MSKSVRAASRKEFWEMAEAAKTEGKDLAEVLDRCGVLLTPRRMAEIKADVYRELVVELESSNAVDWADRDNRIRNPEDFKRAFTARMRLFVEAYERKANGVQ